MSFGNSQILGSSGTSLSATTPLPTPTGTAITPYYADYGTNQTVPLSEQLLIPTLAGVAPGPTGRILIFAYTTLLIGTGTTSVRLRVRRGITGAGVEINDTSTLAVVAAGVYPIVLQCCDSIVGSPPGPTPGPNNSYCMTMTPQNGSAASTCQFASLCAIPI